MKNTTFCLVTSFSARREDHFQKRICPKRTFPSDFVKLGSEILIIYNCFLKSIFLSSMSASIYKKSKPTSDKVATNKQTNKQTNKTTTKVFLSPILQNLRGRSVLDNFFENDPLDEPKRMPLSKKFCLFKRKIVIKIEFTPLKSDLSLSRLQNYSL